MARLLLRDLTPGTNYKIQLRAVEGDSVSEWSRLFDLTTSSDTIAPDVPAWASSDKWVVNGDTFVATWLPLDFEIDRNKDFDHYEIEFSDNVSATVLRTNNTSYTLTFDHNRILFGAPKATVTARVRAVDAVGNASPWNDLQSATNPPPSAPGSLSTTPLYDSVKVSFAPVDDIDVTNYIIQVSTTSASTGFSTVYSGVDTEYVHNTTMFATDHWYRVYAVDKFGSLSSATTSGAVRPKSSFTVDTTPPAVPTGLAATITNNANGIGARASLTWNQAVPSENDLAGFRVRWRKSGDTNWSQTDFSHEDRAGIVELQAAFQNYEFQIRSYDWMGNFSAWSVTATATSPGNTAPAQTVGLASVAGRDSIRLTWTPSTAADLKEYEVTFSTSSTFASGNFTFKTDTAAVLDVGGLSPATTYYMRVRAIDTSNLAGAWSTTHSKVTLAQLTPGDIGAATPDDLDDLVKSYSVEYAVNSSESTAPTTGWSTSTPTRNPGEFIWTRTVVTYNDNTTSTTNPALLTGNTGAPGSQGIQGPPGDTGNTGVGVSSITPYYARITVGSTLPPQPTNQATPPSPWQDTEPGYLSDTELYRTDRIKYSNNTYAYTTRVKVSAYAAAVTAITAANGKNKIIFSTGDATGTTDASGVAYIDGDIWYKRDANGVVIATWEYVTGAGGGWKSRTFGDATLNSLNVGKLVSGDVSAITINIKSTGNIKSDNYSTVNKTGWKLDASGLDIQSGSVRASALIGDTLGSSTGKIQLGLGSSLVTNGGFIRSNNYGSDTYNANATAGFFLSDGNLHIPDGNISAKALKAGVISGTNTIELSGANAKIKGGSWELSGSGLSIPDGGIEARSISLQAGANIVPAHYADFEMPESEYIGANGISLYAPGGVASWSIASTGKFNSQSLKVTIDSISTYVDVTLQETRALGSANIPVDDQTEYIWSGYFNVPASSAPMGVQFVKHDNAGADLSLMGEYTVPNDGQWHRVSITNPYQPFAGATRAGCRIRLYDAGTVYIDGIQLEEKVSDSMAPSSWSPPGSTLLNGGLIRTGSIQSTAPALDANGNTIAGMKAWQINTGGEAVFGDALIRGRLMIGYQNEPVYDPTPDPETGVVPPEDLTGVSMIQSYNYNPQAGRGWSIRSNGMAEFRNLAADSISADAIAAVTPDKLRGGMFGASWILSSDGAIHAGDRETIVVTHRQRAGNVTTLTVTGHNRKPGDRIIEYSLYPNDSSFAVSDAIITAVTATTIKYSNTGANVGTTALNNSTIVAEGRAVEMSKNGLTLLGQDGVTPLINLPTASDTPAVFNGDIEALSLVVKDDLVLQGQSNYVASGSKIKLAENIAPPTTAPTVQTTWKSLKTWLDNEYTAGRSGLVYDASFGGRFITANMFWGTQFMMYNLDGSFHDNVDVSLSGAVSLTKIGSSYYILVNEDSQWRVRNYTLSGTQGNQTATAGAVNWVYDQHAHSAFGVTLGQWNPSWTPVMGNPAMATDGTNLYIARFNLDGKIVVQKFNPANGALLSTVVTSGFHIAGGDSHIRSFEIGNFDLGGARWIMSVDNQDSETGLMLVFNTAGTLQVNETWRTPHDRVVYGFTYYGGKFVALADDNRHYEFTDVDKNTVRSYYVQSSFIDNDDTYHRSVSQTVGSGGTVTYTLPANHGFEVGDVVNAWVSGLGSPQYYVVKAVTTTTVSVSDSWTGSTTATGRVTNIFETSKGPSRIFQPTRRAGFIIKQAGMPATSLPVSPSEARFWMGTAPGTTYIQQGGVKGTATLNMYENPSLSGGTATGVAFPLTEPASIYSENGRMEINADGFGLFGASQDANTEPDNKPPLRVGPPSGTHLRIDGNEIIAMNGNSSQGTLFLNGGGGEVRGYNFTVTNQLNVTGAVVGTTNFPGGTYINSAGGVVVGGGLSVGQNINLSGTFAGQTKFAGGTSAESDGSFVVGTRPQAGSANVNFGAEGKLRIISSSLRFKKDVTDFEYDSDTILDLKPRRYHRIDSEDSSITYPEIGFIAEEAESLGLEEWVEREPDGTVFSFDYYKWVVAHQIVLREQRNKIAALDAEVTRLSNLLD